MLWRRLDLSIMTVLNQVAFEKPSVSKRDTAREKKYGPLCKEAPRVSDLHPLTSSLIDKEVGTMSGLQLLTEKYATRLKELEAQLADAKHKLDIVMEASRFLEEEGLTEDGPPYFSPKTGHFQENT
jgi:hypothetical protein